jgi:hypothetical protein
MVNILISPVDDCKGCSVGIQYCRNPEFDNFVKHCRECETCGNKNQWLDSKYCPDGKRLAREEAYFLEVKLLEYLNMIKPSKVSTAWLNGDKAWSDLGHWEGSFRDEMLNDVIELHLEEIDYDVANIV